MTGQSSKLLELINVTKSYRLADNNVYEALHGISLTIHQGEFVAIMGPSGSGKSTLMHIMGALDVVTSGQYLLQGLDIGTYDANQLARIRNREIGFVFQSFNLLPRTTVYKNIERPLLYGGVAPAERRARIQEALELVKLTDKAHNWPNQLSGGQAQRVAVARALIMRPAIILADEPTGNLDSQTSQEIMLLLTSLHKLGRTVIVITHDPDVAHYAHRLVRIVDGRLVSDKTQK